MKKISTIEEAFAYQLHKMFHTENQLCQPLQTFERLTLSPELRRELQKYVEASSNKVLKLERIYNYINVEPAPVKIDPLSEIVEETNDLVKNAASPQLRDILLISAIKDINAFKLSAYRTMYIYAVELELDTPADLLKQILEWELKTSKAFCQLVLLEFNKAPECCLRFIAE